VIGCNRLASVKIIGIKFPMSPAFSAVSVCHFDRALVPRCFLPFPTSVPRAYGRCRQLHSALKLQSMSHYTSMKGGI
jgi:hypothetical protein